MKELMIHVERIVRPLHASAARKHKMRQELLAHLTSIVEEERARLGDEQLALTQAIQRFGNPADLGQELQASVPLLERWEDRLVRWFLRKPGEGRLHHAVRLAAVVALVIFCSLVLVPLLLVAAGKDWPTARIGLSCLGVVSAYAFLSALVGYGFCRELAERLRMTSFLRAGAYGLAAILVGLLLVAGGSLAQPENPLWRFILGSPGDPHALSAFAFITGLPLIVAVIAAIVLRVETARERRSGGWSSLEIGE